jgi:hypothetical protein
MRAVWFVLIFVSRVSADVPELRGTVAVEATRWVIPVDEITLTPVPVYLDDGLTDPPRTLAPGACQLVARSQPPRRVTVVAHDARMAVVQYHAPGFLDPHECEVGTLVQVPAGHVHQWVLQAGAQTRHETDGHGMVAALTLAIGVIVLLSLVLLLLALGRSRERSSQPSTAQPRPGDP